MQPEIAPGRDELPLIRDRNPEPRTPNAEPRTLNPERQTPNAKRVRHSTPELILASVREDSLLVSPAR
jgi:hypothetical protein